MKIDRLIGITMLLLQKGKVTAPELAERFEVSRRTISRDIEDICHAGTRWLRCRGMEAAFRLPRATGSIKRS